MTTLCEIVANLGNIGSDEFSANYEKIRKDNLELAGYILTFLMFHFEMRQVGEFLIKHLDVLRIANFDLRVGKLAKLGMLEIPYIRIDTDHFGNYKINIAIMLIVKNRFEFVKLMQERGVLDKEDTWCCIERALLFCDNYEQHEQFLEYCEIKISDGLSDKNPFARTLITIKTRVAIHKLNKRIDELFADAPPAPAADNKRGANFREYEQDFYTRAKQQKK